MSPERGLPDTPLSGEDICLKFRIGYGVRPLELGGARFCIYCLHMSASSSSLAFSFTITISFWQSLSSEEVTEPESAF